MQLSGGVTRGKVKRPCATSSRDAHHGHSRRPDVLRRMRPSCIKVWEVLFTKAHGEAIQISLRELSHLSGVSYTHVRRVLVELERVHLIRWRLGGRGRGHKSVIEVLWRSYPLTKDPPIEKLRKNPGMPLQFSGSRQGSFKKNRRPSLDNSPKKVHSSANAETPTAASFSLGTNRKTLPATGQPRLSSRAHRWAVGEFRRRVEERWTAEEIADMDAVGEDGLPCVAIGLDREHILTLAERHGLDVCEGDCAFVEGPDRERAMLLAAREVRKCVVNAFAVALHGAIRRGRIQNGKELADVVEEVLDRLDEDGEQIFRRISEYLSLGSRHAAYSWAGHAIREATDALAAGRMQEQAEMVNQVVDASHEECGDSPGVLLSEGAGAPRLPSRGVSQSWTGLGGARRDRKRARFAADCGEGGSAGEGF